MPNRLWKQPFIRRAAFAAVMLTFMFLTLCWCFGIRSTNDLKAYVGMALECHPVWQDLALHRIYEGQPVDEAIANTKPVSVVRHGRFVKLGYEEGLSFTGVQIIAIDGKLARAGTGSCTWDYTFFDSMTDAQVQEMSDSVDNDERTVIYKGEIIRQPAGDAGR